MLKRECEQGACQPGKLPVQQFRVVFMRDGYPHPCMRPMYNFLGKFKPEPRKEPPAGNHTA
ncbi:DUF4222 domain-containing protein [Escherichia coli]|nr:DUF4222 domain-containing protein [Escherichia coli]